LVARVQSGIAEIRVLGFHFDPGLHASIL
jgi:hypothetical protein